MPAGVHGSGTAPGYWPPPESMRPTLVGERHMVSAGHPLVADVATRAFEQGGNAIDAGVAAGMAANVVQADMCNFGGVAPSVIRDGGSGEVWTVAGTGRWSSEASIEAHLARYGGDMPAGAACAVVPAAPAAWITALRRFGTWTFTDAASFAIELARGGFVIDRRLAESLAICGRTFSGWASSSAIYWPQGRPPRPGEVLVQDDLGRLLGQMASAECEASRTGATREAALEAAQRAFYDSDIAVTIANFVEAGGGWMRPADLAAYSPTVERAVSGQYGNWSIHVPDTWSQGPVLPQMLGILAHFDLATLGHNTADYLHVLIEAVKLAYSDREAWYGDPLHTTVPLEYLLGTERAADHASRIRMNAAMEDLPTVPMRAPHAAAKAKGRRRLDTTSICTLDADGNAFSAAMSDTLDDSPIVPGLGIMVSPRGAQSRLDPTHPAALGPGVRPRITPAPAIAIKDADGKRDVWPMSCPGGDTIPQAMLQVLLNVVQFGMTPQQAVEAPRLGAYCFPDTFFPHDHDPGRVRIEARIPTAVFDDLADRGHRIAPWPEFEFDAGGVTMIIGGFRSRQSRPSRILQAAADPRRSCYASGR